MEQDKVTSKSKQRVIRLGMKMKTASLVQFNANMVNVVFACNLLLKESHLFGFLSISVLFACDFDYRRNKESF